MNVTCDTCGTEFDAERETRGDAERCPSCGTRADVDTGADGDEVGCRICGETFPGMDHVTDHLEDEHSIVKHAIERNTERLGGATPVADGGVATEGEVTPRLDHVDVSHGVGEMMVTTDDVREASVYTMQIGGELKLITETQGTDDAYGVATVVIDPDDARALAAELREAAAEVERGET